ncbi:uroporphyrinogen-III C-methyltransferase [Sporolactobacillus shoreicorticis]|uniref:uroporphyrinogen-III C-methyltransferase n=1 Tax=Sporolactobacillus shoreicorticis TaxID=1923877 RepID=A0ABW5S226_9BACL|nr:uroporphyrinogen-III C-methyltransferase [Sporolactobacillus shoreicorticis]MCO7125183.1 uroporphyrinogen-III C-methyltransferase [Sporolactobacillus shoreicorticis]
MGKVYLVGAGPGDPGLITVKGLRILRTADVILYDRLVNKDLLREAKRNATLIYCGKKPHAHPLNQRAINRLLVNYANEYSIVVRLKGGDPFTFGRGGEEAAELVKEQIDFEIVPGITAGIAAPAYAGIPVTHRGYAGSVAFLTGHSKVGNKSVAQWSVLASAADTLAIYMGVSALPHLVSGLIAGGRSPSTPTALIEWATTEHQRTFTAPLCDLCELAEQAHICNPSMIIVGEVVRLREQLKWFENQRCGKTS